MESFLERIPFLESILFDFDDGTFYISLEGLKKCLLEELAPATATPPIACWTLK
jgi:hypothetical protein